MSTRRLYFDNAATSFPKPDAVTQAMVQYATELGASAGRGGYAEAVNAGKIITHCRALLNKIFNGQNPDHFIFTLNCSDALNIAIKGLIDPNEKSHAICTAIDHNSILRPINGMAKLGWLTRSLIPVDPTNGLVDPAAIEKAIRPDTKLIAITHASNVAGTVQSIREIGKIARSHNIPFIVDAAQSAGHVEIDVQNDFIDLLAAPGHKALMGPLGTGFLYLRPGMEKLVRPLREGGTGSISEHDIQPDFMPDKYEPGSHNAIGIAGLVEGLKWLENKTVRVIHQQQMKLCDLFASLLDGIEGLTCYAPLDFKQRIGVFSIRIDGFTPVELAKKLEDDFGLLTRAGLHCAPHIHAAFGTAPRGGTTRFSFGPYITEDDVRYAAESIAQIAQGVLSV